MANRSMRNEGAEQTCTQPYQRGQLIHELFSVCAADSPDATALIHNDELVSYEMLEAEAQRFAVKLEEVGVGPGHLVPVVMCRSVGLVVAFLGVLKRGAAYAAFDPRWPMPRLARLISLLDAPVVITDDPRIYEIANTAIPDLNLGSPAPTPTVVSVQGDSPACVFFTSGTSGEPKGAISPHRGTVRLFQDCTFAEFNGQTVMPLSSAVSWDALTLELWSVLLNGGCSVVVDEPYLLPEKLVQMVTRHGVNTVSFTSSLFNMFVEESIESFTGLSQVFVGGERVSPWHIGRLLRRHSGLRVLHCYGPVENTLFASTHPVTLADCERTDGIPLGAPVPNTGLHVWNGTRLCDPGEVGELLLSGDGLACGYLGDPVQTAECFPTLDIGGVRRRVYRSGDLAHWSHQGTLHFDGRADRQVKIRGHRIEPAEVELAAVRVPGVSECAAVPIPNNVGGYETILLAYTSRDSRPVDEQDLLEHIRGQLPAHLLPGRVARLPALPLNDNGKLDADALLQLCPPVSQLPTTPEPLREDDELMATVARIAGSVLRQPAIPRDADFVMLGGTSLDIGAICTRLAATLHVSVSISDVIGRTTVRQLANWLRDVTIDARGAASPEALDGGVPLTGMQESFLFRQAAYPADITALCPLGWWTTGQVDEEALAAALGDVQHRHEALRARYFVDEHRHEPRPVAVVEQAGTCKFDRLVAATDSDALERLRGALLRPLDIENGQVWRAALVRVSGSARALLGVVVHHVAFDGWSEHILTRDLSTSYAARISGVAPVFPTNAVTMTQAMALVRGMRARRQVSTQRRTWQRLLAGIPELALPAPTPNMAPRRDAWVGGSSCLPATQAFRIESADVDRVERLARTHTVTPFTVWLAAFAAAVRKLTHQADFGVGVPVYLREGMAVTDTVGCLIDVICLRLRPTAPDWPDLIEHVRDVLHSGRTMQTVPLTEVARLVNPPRTGRDPLYQAMLVYQDGPRGMLKLPGVQVEPAKIPAVQATSEVVTELWPSADGSVGVDVTFQANRVAGHVPADLVDALTRVIREGPQAGPPALWSG